MDKDHDKRLNQLHCLKSDLLDPDQTIHFSCLHTPKLAISAVYRILCKSSQLFIKSNLSHLHCLQNPRLLVSAVIRILSKILFLFLIMIFLVFSTLQNLLSFTSQQKYFYNTNSLNLSSNTRLSNIKFQILSSNVCK